MAPLIFGLTGGDIFWYHAQGQVFFKAGMSRWVAAFRLTGVGFFIGICILGGTFAGYWLDGKVNTKPVFLIAGLLLGLIVAVIGVYQMLIPLIKNRRDKENG